MEASFIAFGQDHTDGNALEAVKENVMLLHSTLKDQGKELVLAVEHAQEDIRTDPRKIAELHNEGMIQKYFDETREQGGVPSVADFRQKYGGQLRMDSLSLRTLTMADVQDVPRANARARILQTRQDAKFQTFFNDRQTESGKDVNVGKGPSRIQEAAILQYAQEQNIRLVGLDPLSDAEKRQRLQKEGAIGQVALEDAEYERVQGMAKKACETMSELAQGTGGCVVAFNMGPAHLGSVETTMQEKISQRPELNGAKVKISVLTGKDAGQAESQADEWLNMGPEEMVISVKRAEQALENANAQLTQEQTNADQLGGMMQRFDQLSEKQMVSLANSPKALTDHLNLGMEDSDYSFDEDMVNEMLVQAETEFAQGQHATLKDAFAAQFGDIHEAHEELELEVSNLGTKWEQARATLQARQHEADFAQQVKDRLSTKPPEVYTAVDSNNYRSSVKTTMQDANGIPHVESVKERLGKKFAKQEQHSQNVAQGIDEAHPKVRDKIKQDKPKTGVKIKEGGVHL